MSSHHRDNRLGLAQVVDLVRHPRLDEDEVTRLVVDAVPQPVAVRVANPAFQQVEHYFEFDVDVGVGHAAGRNRGHVEGKLPGGDVAGRQAARVGAAVPAAAHAAAPQGADPAQPLGGGNRCVIAHAAAG